MLSKLFSNINPYGQWDFETINMEFDYSVFGELNNGKKRYKKLNRKFTYEIFLLSDCRESESEIGKILLNAKRTTQDRFFNEKLNLKRRSEKEKKEFEKRYGELSVEEQNKIKKNRLSKINRYESRFETYQPVKGIDSLSDNISNYHKEIEVLIVVTEVLNKKAILFIHKLQIAEPEKIALQDDIKLNSVQKRRKLLYVKVRNSFTPNELFVIDPA